MKTSTTVGYHQVKSGAEWTYNSVKDNPRQAVSTVADFVPIVGNIKGGMEALSGKDYITGYEFEHWERGVAAAAIFGGGIAKAGGKGYKLVKNSDFSSVPHNAKRVDTLDSHNVSNVGSAGKGTVKATPDFGRKMEYVFGKATGTKHNIDCSIAMERQLNSIGIFNNDKGRKLVLGNLTDSFNDASSILKTQDNGRIVRESLLSGPNGLLKVESVWDKEKLITVKLFGGR
ncbi:pre-toxin TG domain-containing protein [Evansella sp. AB-rgal1]|uniref:pre-toxin TG domain-containing protein n=1 Tax=Evansella sp. AB-rgal1 TaxID=3242696 RepID=UPI00359DC7BA